MMATVIEHPIDLRAQAEAAPAPRLRISARFLLGIYAIVPLCLAAMIFDRLYFTDSVIRSLRMSPESYFILQLAFGTPHIIASSILLAANTDYLRTFWLRLVVFTLLLLAFFAVGYYWLGIPYDGFLAVIGAATVLHVIKQQVGIGKGMCRPGPTGWVYDVWGWTMVVFGSILYFAVYKTSVEFSGDSALWVNGTLVTLAALLAVLTIACHARISTTMGRLYLWANALMALQSGLFYAQGYLFLAILGPRLIHDVTAFTFYVAHDVNRHGAKPQSWLYLLASKLGLGVFWVCPVLAVLLTYLLDRYTDDLIRPVTQALGFTLPYPASFLFIGYLGLLHYYTEAFTWKHGSPYREHVAFSP